MRKPNPPFSLVPFIVDKYVKLKEQCFYINPITRRASLTYQKQTRRAVSVVYNNIILLLYTRASKKFSRQRGACEGRGADKGEEQLGF